MKRLLLLSSGLTYLLKFIDQDPKQTNMLFIPTAGNLDKDVWWIDKDRDVLHKMGFKITELDIANASTKDMEDALSSTNLVYVAGGNTFYLLNQLRVSGFDKLLTDYVNNGGLYAGASAGALVAGPDIGSISSIDEPEKVEGLTSTKALGFVDIVPIPHYDMKERTQPIDRITAKYGKDNELVIITDDQAILVEEDNWQVVNSGRSPLELEWFRKNNL